MASEEKNNEKAPETAPKKKKFTAVFRPQNAQQIRVKPKTAPKPAAAKPAAETKPAPEVKPAAAEVKPAAEVRPAPAAAKPAVEVKPAPAAETKPAPAAKPAAPEVKPAAVEAKPAAAEVKTAAEVRPAPEVKPAAEPVKRQEETVKAPEGQTGSGRPAAAPGVRPAGTQPVRQGSYQGTRPGAGQGSYQGTRPGAGQGSYQGTRPGAGQGSYQGTRPGAGQGGYQGTRQGGYQGTRPGAGQGGYQGTRPGAGQGGYQGSRPGADRAGFQGARPGAPAGARPGYGQRPADKQQGAGDGALVKKTVSNRPSKQNYKDKNDKRHRTEDGFKTSKSGKVNRHPFIMPEKQKVVKEEEQIKEILIPETISISDLAKAMKKNASEIIKKLFIKGEIYTPNSEISFEKAEEIALEYDILCTKEEPEDVIAELLKETEENEDEMETRPPVVCVMGHVDHGKTSLLDAIRKTNVTSREAGGITQHIGAYQVKINDRLITFLDTPGHEAFTAMRMRGALATDIAVLVVAADDGIMPQTIEAINHAKAAGVEVIVAINKIDKPDANVDRVKQELIQYELVPEDWGGTTICCPISAKTREGIEDLLENILLAADVKELKANPNRNARGLVIEAQLDKGKGPVATVLVQKGTLHVGDFVAAGSCYGKVRAMLNDKGARVKDAKPSTPVAIQGLNAVPNAGEVFVAMSTDKEAKDFAATFINEGKNKLIEETKAKLSLDDLFGQIKAGNIQELPIIVKADVQGSVEAVKQSLSKLSNEEVQVKVIHSAVGAISESDVALASASNAIIIGFNVRPDALAKSTADHEHVDIRLYRVIYQAIEDIENAMKGMLAPVYEEKIIGHAEVRMLFKASGVGTIAGSYILDGKIQRGCKARITRDGAQIFDGPLASLKRFKDDVKEVNAGYECGLVFEKFNDLAEGDLVEAYAMVEVPRT